MDITLQYFDSCPNWKIADQRVRTVIADHGLDADVEYQLVESPEDAEKYRFHGSPTLLIDGVDPFATEDTKVGFACRVYHTEAGTAEAPSVQQIAQALGV
jgi:hypothetical protein